MAFASPFLTALDSRALVKGSRDPLGIQAIWTRFGRHVVGNLTTVSSSLRDFTTTILGYHFAEVVADSAGPGSQLATFLKWEQLAAYSRAHANKDLAFRGTERVFANLSEGSPVTISADRSFHILGNQKVYGLWGLYTVATRESGLLQGDPPRLTPAARGFCEENYLSRIQASRIVEMLASEKAAIDFKKRDAKVLAEIGALLRWKLSPAEKDFYRRHLVDGGPLDKTQGRQRQLAMLLEPTLKGDFEWSPKLFLALAKEARTNGAEWESLAERLDRIRVCESVLAPVSALFTWLLGMNERPRAKIEARIQDRWRAGLPSIEPTQFRALVSEIGAADVELGKRWMRIAEAAARGHFGDLVDGLIEQNQAVMKARGGAAWCDWQDEKLVVRFRDEEGDLPDRDHVGAMWRFPYFVDSLRDVTGVVCA